MKLIAIDLDGTLLSENGTISLENIEAIQEVQKQGSIIAINSGRSLHDTQKIILDAGIDCPIITGNGAIAYHSNEPIQKLIMPDIVITEILPLLETKGYYYELYTNQGVRVLQNGKKRLEDEIHRIKEKDVSFPFEWANKEIEIQFKQHGLQVINHYSDINITDMEIYKIFVLSFQKERLQQLRKSLSKRQDISITTSGWTKLEIAHTEVSKGNALTYLASHLNIPLENTVAIGDNLNDLSMFQVAGTSIAMGNAEDEVKQQSTFVTRNLNDHGVAYALRKYVLSENI